ncbi:hypothetical protein [Persicirhabdus sediminis]|uniref:Uncharacterized protein n=1 Tax=Persicirhabdus sediminis TaxID=454144 RepID=A0A8J7SKF3_9BACT|nr:hypothetical protein [Persicirhabdus sediminis]MBK1792029.1 hypothetical protein [Persicirhabdus sediminis]
MSDMEMMVVGVLHLVAGIGKGVNAFLGDVLCTTGVPKNPQETSVFNHLAKTV